MAGMNRLSKALVMGAMGVSAACIASSASAVVTIPCPGGTLTRGCSFTDVAGSGTFFDTISKAGSVTPFDDVFTVVLGLPGDVTIRLTSSPQGITFASLLFDGSPFAFGSAGTTFTKDAGTYDLRLVGSVTRTASFSGTIDFAPAVPEPATWAMMITGFAGVGTALRRRRVKLVRGMATA
jgi:hypothetical protein